MDDRTKEAVTTWKTHRYKPNHLPFTEAVYSLLTASPLIRLKRSAVRPNEWVVCHIDTSTPAVMTFAGVFAEADPYDTGNLVIDKNEVPYGLNEVRVTRFAGFKAAYSYAIETYHDKEIWDLQRTLDEHVKNDVPEFNHERRPRLEWQNGETQGWQFYIRVPMFLPYQARGEKPKAPDRLHDWVKVAHARTRSYRANPNRPQVRAVEDGEIRDIARCAKPRLEYGDVVGLVFTVVYVETPANWSPVYMLTDIIRVMHANRDSYPLAAPDEFDDAVTDDGALSVTNVTPASGSGPVQVPAHVPNPVMPIAPPSSHLRTSLTASPSASLEPRTVAAIGPSGSSSTVVAPFHDAASQSNDVVAQPVLFVHSDTEADDDSVSSSAAEVGGGSSEATSSIQGKRSSGGNVENSRNVRIRLDDTADVAAESEPHLVQAGARGRRGVASKVRPTK